MRSQKKQLYSRGAYIHFAVAISLSAVLPLLVVLYFLRSESATVSLSTVQWIFIGIFILVVVTSGYVLLWRYPATIVRLRSCLASIVNAELPEMVDLSAGEQDIEDIEIALNRVLEMLREKLHVVESQKTDLERQLFRTRKLEAIGTLAAGIAHEINTPLQLIGNNAEFIDKACSDMLLAVERNKDGPDREQLDFLRNELSDACNSIEGGVARVANIIKAIQDFTKGGDEKQQQPIDLNQTIETILEITRNEWKYHSRVETDLDSELSFVNCFPGEIKNTITSLLLNSTQAIEQKRQEGDKEMGLISISTRLEGKKAIISIADNGCGIPEKFHNRVFDPFFTTREVNSGKGCGLTFAHTSIVKRHGGTIDFVSEENKGTVFTLTLPVDNYPSYTGQLPRQTYGEASQ